MAAAVGVSLAPFEKLRGEEATGKSRGKAQPEEQTLATFLRASPLNDELLFGLGGAGYGVSEIGEMLHVVGEINGRTGNPLDADQETFDWCVEEWVKMGSRLEGLARDALKSGHRVTARDRFLRASTCFDQALFFVLGTSRPDREESLFRSCQGTWLEAINLWDPRPDIFTVKAGDLDLPAYFFRPRGFDEKRPTYVICNGSDGQNVEAVSLGVAAALERGYNVLIFEGPGQMSLLFEKKIAFRPNWAPILRAINASLQSRKEVDPDRIAACGISFLGMVLASAAVEGSGLSAVVLEPGGVSALPLWHDSKSMAAVQGAQGASAEENAQIRSKVNDGLLEAWKDLPAEVRFEICKRGEIFSSAFLEEARAGKPPSDYFGLMEAILPFDYTEDLRKIAIPTLVLANEHDEFFGDQSKRCYGLLDRLSGDKKRFVELTAAMGAQFHDQPLGQRVAQEIVFDWLDEQFAASAA